MEETVSEETVRVVGIWTGAIRRSALLAVI